MIQFSRKTKMLLSISAVCMMLIFASDCYSFINHLINFRNSQVFVLANPFVEGSQCTWKFYGYKPSSWERHWFSNIDDFQYEVCSRLAPPDEVNKTVDVLHRIIQLQQRTFHSTSRRVPIDEHFSQMHYRRTCSTGIQEAVELIEPLIGQIRDPLTICPRLQSVPSDLYLEGEYAIQSKRFILLSPSAPFKAIPSIFNVKPLAPWLYKNGAKKILIDIGSSYFNSRNGNTAEVGSRWFYEYFRDRSIRFDRIIAFEFQQLSPRKVWEELPDDVFPIYTFINLGVEDEKTKFNPWTTLKAIANSNDYVIVKLDIDTPALETALIKQLLNDDVEARSLIDEMFFEKHVSLDRKSSEDKLKDSYELFTKMRQSGIRMHGWP